MLVGLHLVVKGVGLCRSSGVDVSSPVPLGAPAPGASRPPPRQAPLCPPSSPGPPPRPTDRWSQGLCPRVQKWFYEKFGEYVEDFRFQPEESTVETEEPLSARRWGPRQGGPSWSLGGPGGPRGGGGNSEMNDIMLPSHWTPPHRWELGGLCVGREAPRACGLGGSPRPASVRGWTKTRV